MNVQAFAVSLKRLTERDQRAPKTSIPRVSRADRVVGIAREFVIAQTAPSGIGAAIDFPEPSSELLVKLFDRATRSKHPAKAQAALELFRAVNAGELVTIEED